ncbi:MAG: glycoside hydrolase family 97 protein [Muribaculaceae bacterium]|nr:glycoside hydrolase family 97 protein [Muribaculaceae bacterium]
MNRISASILCSFIATTSLLTTISTNATPLRLTSPDGHLQLTVGIDRGKPFYTLCRDNDVVISPSHLGFLLADGNLADKMKITASNRDSHDDTWTTVWGEDESIRNHYNELAVNLRGGKPKAKMTIVFRLFNDGLGFRYEIPEQKALPDIVITDELTEFSLPKDVPAWSIPTNHTLYYENIFTRDLLSQKDTVNTPLTIEAAPDMHIAIHQAALVDYADLNLTPRVGDDGSVTLLSALTPWQDNTKVKAGKSLISPWRTVIVGRQAGDLITSRLMLNLNEPCAIDDTSWITPGRYIGIWWSIHKKHHTWEQGPTHGANTANMKRYIDFAAKHGFSGVLAEGWNFGWGEGEEISFTKAYPDFDLEGLAKYAREKGVFIVGHTETWGKSRLLEAQMEEAFALYERLGIKVVKTGYVGAMLDGEELQHSQYGARHYRRVLECAARHHIMIDNHEPMMPTGIQRTLPNLMTQEGVRGQEYNAWSTDGGNPPSHTATLPFTRGLAGPMDFTPAIFNFGEEVVKGTRPQSTIAKQLAEFVVLYSPLQMAADAIENYEGHPALSFIESCPTTWRRTVVPNGEVGRYVTIAREARDDSGRWFIGSLTDKTARTLKIDLSFLQPGVRYAAMIYEDGSDADYIDNPMSLAIRQCELTSADSLTLHLARSGGAAIRLTPIK